MTVQQSDDQKWLVKDGLAKMLKGGVIMDVTTVEQAKIAEDAGACAVMALERIPADIRRMGEVARMSDPEMIAAIQEAVTIPVMAKCRIGHSAEASLLQAMDIDFIDESEVLTPADEQHHILKHDFQSPFVCGARNLAEALRRIDEGAAMIRTKGEAGTGNIVEAVRHMRCIQEEIRQALQCPNDELPHLAKQWSVSLTSLQATRRAGRLPVVNFAAGGVATPADAVLMMRLGADGVFVGSGVFKAAEPVKVAKAMVEAVTHYQDMERVLAVSRGLGSLMPGMPKPEEAYAERGQ